ncbi:hypothetical protein ABE425_14690 [Chryseobacterium cucumeris]|uniref:hypothetical protein n=1 Tax=Chryseobacterium cucumeris TaxID=1813611 RepID=UPI0032093A1A
MESIEMTIKRNSEMLGIPVSQIEDMFTKGCDWEGVFKYAAERAQELKASIEGVNLPPRRKKSNYTKPRNRKKKSKY